MPATTTVTTTEVTTTAAPTTTESAGESTAESTTATTPQPSRTSKPKPAGTPPADNESAVLALVNTERADSGCGPVRWNADLADAARAHSVDMAEQDYFDHTSLDGRSPFDRMRAHGYDSPGGENIAAGQRTPESVMESWMTSPGHRANILNCDYTTLGVGIGKGGSYGVYWTQNFGF
ncbi:CAP domain-containing protein [Actinokineospora guangxiensis]|uniref:CAP domain-containing protein n=1 Tax=Actinokineospora guangxiensis TaxID=1490288 RepID=A0ABW0EG85_9PSEU